MEVKCMCASSFRISELTLPSHQEGACRITAHHSTPVLFVEAVLQVSLSSLHPNLV